MGEPTGVAPENTRLDSRYPLLDRIDRLVSTMMAQSSPLVLLVDGDSAMIQLHTKWLENGGYRVRAAKDGCEALAAIEADCPQFLIANLDLPHFSGLELCTWVRMHSLPNYIVTIVLTASGGSKHVVQGMEAGADHVLKKPASQDELLAHMRAGLRVLELESRLNRLARCDSLTGLYTQRTFYELLGKEWSRSARHQTPLSCVILDIDFFKRVNDTYGHGTGDEVIRRVARILERHSRQGDVISRYGGEEFCALLPQTTEIQAVEWAERIRRELAKTPIIVGDRELRITASFGAAQRQDDTDTPEELVDMADQALLVSKQSGRDQVTSFQTMNDSSRIHANGARASAFAGLLARDVMTTIVAGLHKDEKVGRAVDYFLHLRINSAPVVDDDKRLVGILSEKDVMAILLLPNWWETTIADVMKRGAVSYEEETSAQTIYEFLYRVAIRSVVVVKDGRPTGVISRASLLRWFTNVLITKGEAGELGAAAPAFEAPSDVRQQLIATTAKLTEQAHRLEHDVMNHALDLAPHLVGGASQIQELVNDLLGYSRYMSDAAPTTFAANALGPGMAQGLHQFLQESGVEHSGSIS